jgi:hypothetical protein
MNRVRDFWIQLGIGLDDAIPTWVGTLILVFQVVVALLYILWP